MKSRWDEVAGRLEEIAGWARNGLEEAQIARNLGIAESTYYKYKAAHTELVEAIKNGKEVCDLKVEGALYKSCMGYNATILKHYKLKTSIYDEETGRKISEKEELVETEDQVHVPANVTAQIWWLKNRVPERWKDRVPDGEGEAGGGGIVEMPAMMEPPAPPGDDDGR